MDQGLAAVSAVSKEGAELFQARLNEYRHDDGQSPGQKVASEAEVDQFLRDLYR